jgi:hypothetical protein
MTLTQLDILVYRPGAMMPEPRTIDLVEVPSFLEIKHVLSPLIRGGIEHVSVLFRGERHDMFVHETGAADGLPVNDAATLIYHEASRQRGQDTTGAPKIYGVAILTMRRVWF